MSDVIEKYMGDHKVAVPLNIKVPVAAKGSYATEVAQILQ